MRKIGIFKGIFDPISQRELKEALSWMKDEKLSFVVFEIENEATISISERKSLVKKAIKPYRKLLLDYNFHHDDVILHKEASNIDEEEIRKIAKENGLDVAEKPDSQDFYDGEYNEL